jgi:hypothetical protein
MKKQLAAFLIALAPLAGCVVYDYPPPYYGAPGGPSAFDRSWSAAVGAMHDLVVQIGVEDRASGVIEGRRGGLTVAARLNQQADGRVRVEFNTRGQLSEDPGLSDRVSRSYDARMGR